QMNLMRGIAADGVVKVGSYTVPVDAAASPRITGDVTIGVRPENWRVVGEADGGLPVNVVVIEELGADGFVYGTADLGGGETQDVIVRVSARQRIFKGDVLHVTTDPHHVHVFDTQTGERLS